MKIIATSDLHGHLPDIQECDILLIAGDVCPVKGSHEPAVQRAWLRHDFAPWLETLPAKDIVWIAGNHDFACEQPGFQRIADELPGHYLIDQSIELQGIKIYGSPWVPNLPGWAFHRRNDEFEAQAQMIPNDADIVMLHGPPHNILDGIPIPYRVAMDHVGAPYVGQRLSEIEPRLVVFGHIHEGYGTQKIGQTEYANVAHMTGIYEPINPPVEFIWP